MPGVVLVGETWYHSHYWDLLSANGQHVGVEVDKYPSLALAHDVNTGNMSLGRVWHKQIMSL